MHLLHLGTSLLALPFSLAAVVPPSSRHHTSRWTWTRLSDGLISYIWPVPPPPESPPTSPPKDIGLYASQYKDQVVLRFNVSTPAEAESLAIASDDLYLDVWGFSDNWVDIRLDTAVVPSLLGLLPTSLQRAHTQLIPSSSLVAAVAASRPQTASLHDILSGARPSEPTSPFPPPSRRITSLHDAQTPLRDPEAEGKDLFFADYRPLSVITPWMALLASMFPTHVSLITIGTSYEGRPIQGLRIGVRPPPSPPSDPLDPPEPQEPRKTLLITGGLHAREWVSVSSVTYIAYRAALLYSKSPLWTRLLTHYDLIFLPVLNPDGYVHSWTTDRLWRKNRQPTSMRFCAGLDLDRSFGFMWERNDAGASNPCSESFPGEAAWDGVEARALADWARNATLSGETRFVALLDLHSYSQQVLYPYSYSCAAWPPSLEDLEELALGLAKAMRGAPHGRPYNVLSACEGNVAVAKRGAGAVRLPRIERGGGAALDWFYHELKTPFAFQVKLRDVGSYGFLLPRGNIIPQGREVLSAVEYMGRWLMGELGFEAEEAEGEGKTERDVGKGVGVVKDVVEETALAVVNAPEEYEGWFRRRRWR
ncbi:hypothetical protein EJ06DRAFT_493346 [Trichodelitschia bisporula]|uniref:Inactive metallocarboxypeptidase ECM14 n=1 Tax=Trichodelitschia bisporula TaxID=703511 RepID=A0A6G1HXT4_9PEZI|nr:hypothetical protein EJ06DRAFT_493346 [Trichodelitschia bisporula]